MKTQAMLGLFAAGAVALAGCAAAMTPEVYSANTRRLLETRNDAIKACYDVDLRTTHDAGSVTVHFKVQQDTGRIVEVKLDGAPPAALGACITQALDGLVLAPPDPNNGVATFTWDFTAGPPAPPP
jgi:hypothetical protein